MRHFQWKKQVGVSFPNDQTKILSTNLDDTGEHLGSQRVNKDRSDVAGVPEIILIALKNTKCESGHKRFPENRRAGAEGTTLLFSSFSTLIRDLPTDQKVSVIFLANSGPRSDS